MVIDPELVPRAMHGPHFDNDKHSNAILQTHAAMILFFETVRDSLSSLDGGSIRSTSLPHVLETIFASLTV